MIGITDRGRASIECIHVFTFFAFGAVGHNHARNVYYTVLRFWQILYGGEQRYVYRNLYIVLRPYTRNSVGFLANTSGG
jgi:hypothetical protein